MSDYATDAQMPAWAVALMDRGRDLRVTRDGVDFVVRVERASGEPNR